MSDIENGGPAFPCEKVGHDELGEYRLPWQGMTLRDYFAASVIKGLLSDLPQTLYGLDWKEKTACAAYEVADAMLEARKK